MDITGIIFVLIVLVLLCVDKYKSKNKKKLHHIGDTIEWK